MYYLLFLDRTDDLSSVRKRIVDLNVGTITEVGLVIPADNRAFAAPSKRDPESRRLPSQEGGGSLNFRLLKRHADALCIRLAIIAADRHMRLQAAQQELPSFARVSAYRRYAARQRLFTQRKSVAQAVRVAQQVGSTGSRLITTTMKVGLITIFMGLLLGGLYAFVPSATVTVAPVSEPLNMQVMVRSDPSARVSVMPATPDAPVRIPAIALQQPISGTMVITTTGLRFVPSTRSSGQVSFFNKTNQEIAIPRGSIVIANQGQRYQTVDDVKLPPVLWSMRRVGIVAELPGSAGNADELQINNVAGPLNLQVVVLNEGPVRGGDERRLTVVSQEDKDTLRAQLWEQLQRNAIRDIQNHRELGGVAAAKEGGGRLTLIQPSIHVKVEDEFWSHKVDQESQSLSLTMRVRATALAFDYNDLTSVANQVWASRIKSGFAPVPGSLKVSSPQVVRIEGNAPGTALMQVNIQGMTAAKIDEGNIREIVRGRSIHEAEQVLASTFKLASEPRVNVQPSWTDRALRVEVVIAP